MLAKRYLDKGLELIQRLQETQLGYIERAAEMIAQATKDADLVVIDEEAEVYITMVSGQVVYRASEG